MTEDQRKTPFDYKEQMFNNDWRIRAIEEMGLTHRIDDNGFHVIEGKGFKYSHTILMCAMRRIGYALAEL